MITKTSNTYWVKICISGPIDVIEQTCREECLRDGLCVTIDPTRFVYTGGEEIGAVVGLINYPRFPKDPEQIWERALDLAEKLLDATCQHSVLIMNPSYTTWKTKREQ